MLVLQHFHGLDTYRPSVDLQKFTDPLREDIFEETILVAFAANVEFVNGSVVYPTAPSEDMIVPTPRFKPWLTKKSYTRINMNSMNTTERMNLYHKTLLTRADEDKVILLSMVDSGYVDMTVNFYQTSIKPLKIKNVLFVSLTHSACTELDKYRIPCFHYMLPDNSSIQYDKAPSGYMTPAFLQKMAIRTMFLLDALKWGFSILQTDVDVTFFKDPFSYFTCLECDMEVLEDGMKGLLNAGFLFMRHTPATIATYTNILDKLKNDPKAEDQAVLNNVVKRKMKGKIKYHLLDAEKFLSGKDYFESPRRYFADTATHCYECVVVHNNWIVSKEAKVYRYKELHMWLYDGPKQYYSSENRHYLVYKEYFKVARKLDETFFVLEKNALRNAFAIAKILNRIVILPKFHGKKIRLPLNSFVYLTHFDAAFGNDYRENAFLSHASVPNNVKRSAESNVSFIITKENQRYPSELRDSVTFLSPKDTKSGATEQEIRDWFSHTSDVPVLKFHSLYGAFSKLDDAEQNALLEQKLQDGLKKAVYRQYVN